MSTSDPTPIPAVLSRPAGRHARPTRLITAARWVRSRWQAVLLTVGVLAWIAVTVGLIAFAPADAKLPAVPPSAPAPSAPTGYPDPGPYAAAPTGGTEKPRRLAGGRPPTAPSPTAPAPGRPPSEPPTPSPTVTGPAPTTTPTPTPTPQPGPSITILLPPWATR